jgi:hypothetical protein
MADTNTDIVPFVALSAPKRNVLAKNGISVSGCGTLRFSSMREARDVITA